MSAHEQGDEVPSAGAAAASAPTAGEGQQSEQRALEETIRELKDLKATINTLDTKIKSDEAKADTMEDKAERVALRRAIAANTERLNLLEVERAELRHEIKQLSAPVEQPTAAGETLSYLVLTLALTHRLASQGITRAPLATRT